LQKFGAIHLHFSFPGLVLFLNHITVESIKSMTIRY
jgi:hypothetical protein